MVSKAQKRRKQQKERYAASLGCVQIPPGNLDTQDEAHPNEEPSPNTPFGKGVRKHYRKSVYTKPKQNRLRKKKEHLARQRSKLSSAQNVPLDRSSLETSRQPGKQCIFVRGNDKAQDSFVPRNSQSKNLQHSNQVCHFQRSCGNEPIKPIQQISRSPTSKQPDQPCCNQTSNDKIEHLPTHQCNQSRTTEQPNDELICRQDLEVQCNRVRYKRRPRCLFTSKAMRKFKKRYYIAKWHKTKSAGVNEPPAKRKKLNEDQSKSVKTFGPASTSQYLQPNTLTKTSSVKNVKHIKGTDSSKLTRSRQNKGQLISNYRFDMTSNDNQRKSESLTRKSDVDEFHKNGQVPKVGGKRKTSLPSKIPNKRSRNIPKTHKGNKGQETNLKTGLRPRKTIYLSKPDKTKHNNIGQKQLNPTFKKLKVYCSTKLKKNVFRLLWSDPKLENMLTAHCVGPRSVVRLQAKCLLKWCLVARRRLVSSFQKAHDKLRSRCEYLLQVAKECTCDSERKEAILGSSRHTSFTEAYFNDTCYEQISEPRFTIPKPDLVAMYRNGEVPVIAISSFTYAISKDGILMNIFSEVCKTKKTTHWQCGLICKSASEDQIKLIRKKFHKISKTTLDRQMIYLLRGMNNCNNMCSKVCKRGHSLGCRIVDGNGAFLVLLQNLMPHYPKLRTTVRALQDLKHTLFEIDSLDADLYELRVEKLQALADKAKLAGGEFKAGPVCFTDEDAIVQKYVDSFKVLETVMSDLPTNYCFSCERLLSRKKAMSRVDRLKSIPDNVYWRDAFKRAQNRGVSVEWVCKFCLDKFRQTKLPSVSCLNRMDVPEVPLCIRKLSPWGKQFIQRAKPCQTIKKKGTVAGKNIPASNLIPTMTGSTFHLPLPLEQTLAKMLKPHETIMPNQELYILVRGLPQMEQKKIWESLLNVTDILETHQWLKMHNFLFADMILPKSAEEYLHSLQDLNADEPAPLNSDNNEDEDYNSDNSEDIDDPLPQDNEDSPGSDLPHRHDYQHINDCAQPSNSVTNNGHTKNTVREPAPAGMTANNPEETTDPEMNAESLSIIENDIRAMLTQCNKDDEFYANYTILPVYDKRQCKLATEMYQMVKVRSEALDTRTRMLDAMCFPDLYPDAKNCLNDDRAVKLDFMDFVKAKLISRHPQFRQNIQYLFFLLNQANLKQLSAGIFQTLNVTKEKLTAGQFLERLENDLLERDMGCVFRRLRNSAEFWKVPRNQIFCMLDHYGPATFFLTLSPADYDDKELEEFLRAVNGKEADGKSLSALIAANPVDVSRFYDLKLHAMLKFITQPDGPLGTVEHFVWRREYQARGVVHFHMLIWIKGAPMLGKSTSEEVSAFIQTMCSCSLPDKETFPILYKRIKSYQEHRCNPYCLRLKKFQNNVRRKVCRFNFPRDTTDKFILRDVPTAIAGRRNLVANSRLYDLPRKENEVRINDYNSAILLAWTGNMDIQYIGEDTSVIARYVTKYQTKPEKSHMVDVFNDINSTKSVSSRLWNIGLRGLSNRECGALEAADTLLGAPLFGTDKSTSIKWIDVGISRSRRLKTKQQIQKLDLNDEDLYCANVIDTHYPNRPSEMQDVCLYDYVAQWDIIKEEPKRHLKLIDKMEKSGNSQGQGGAAPAPQIPTYYKYQNLGFLRKRELRLQPPLHPHLVNHYRIDWKQKPDDYCYSLLLLFKPWRVIDELKGLHATYIEAFDAEKDSLPNAKKYHEKRTKGQTCWEAMRKLIENKSNEFKNKVPEKPVHNHHDVLFQARDIIEAMNDFRAAADDDKEEDLPALEKQLNPDQKRVYDKVKAALLAGKPFRHFVSGVGGTGKSFLIRVIALWVKKVLKKDVAITAPTGIAAFNINGFTIHRILQLPVEHGNKPLKYTRLSDHVLNILRVELKNVALFILDEVSMVSSVTLMMIHLRLSEIFDTFDIENAFFGNIPILVLGDLLQLAPVRGNPPFESLTSRECEKHFSAMSSFNLWKELFTYDELQINMRQRSDETFCKLLTNVRLGFCSEEDQKLLKSRLIPEIEEGSPDDRLIKLARFILEHEQQPICLLPKKRMCDRLNKAVLSLLPAKESIVLVAQDSVDCKPSEQDKVRKVLQKEDDDCSNTAGLDKVIVLKEGARIMLRRNIDVTKGYVNGATGTVVSVKRGIDGLPESLCIRMKNSILDLTPVKSKFEILPGIYVYRTQFAIMIAYAVSIHKSQGLSLDAVLLDIGNEIFARGQAYVALSRAKTLDGVLIINFDPEKIQALIKGLKEYSRLRSSVDYLKSKSTEIKRHKKNPSIKDRVWAPFNITIDVADNNPSVKESQTPVLPTFENLDKLSSYANALLLCMLSIEPLRCAIRRPANDNALKMIANQFFQRKKKLTAMRLRIETGAPFDQQMQQDPSEFFKALVNRTQTLSDATKFTEVRTTQCVSCKNTTAESTDSHILQLPVLQSEKNILSLLKRHFSTSTPCNVKCIKCKKERGQENIIVRDANNILVVQFQLHQIVNGQVSKISKFQMNGLSTTLITVDNKRYKLHSALFYHGPNIEHAHFTAIVRSDQKFIWADDNELSESQWPRGSTDVYMLFYVQVDCGSKRTKMQPDPLTQRTKKPHNPITKQNTKKMRNFDELREQQHQRTTSAIETVEVTQTKPLQKNRAKPSTILPTNTTRQRKVVNQPKAQPLKYKILQCPRTSSDVPKKNILKNILPPFSNTDGISCYANAILQCLLSHEPLRIDIGRFQDDDTFKRIANDYPHTTTTLSAVGIRQEIGHPFTQRMQQDAPEFLLALIDFNFPLQLKTIFWQREEYICSNSSCGYKSASPETTGYILHLPVIAGEKNMNRYLDNWLLAEERTCGTCKSTVIKQRTHITSASDMLIIQFMLFEVRNGQSIKITDFEMQNLVTTVITVAGNTYQLHAAVFHHGPSVHQGHYTAVVRKEDKLILANDEQISECCWPKNDCEVYLLFYSKVEH